MSVTMRKKMVIKKALLLHELRSELTIHMKVCYDIINDSGVNSCF
jgi:hypothetical protein